MTEMSKTRHVEIHQKLESLDPFKDWERREIPLKYRREGGLTHMSIAPIGHSSSDPDWQRKLNIYHDFLVHEYCPLHTATQCTVCFPRKTSSTGGRYFLTLTQSADSKQGNDPASFKRACLTLLHRPIHLKGTYCFETGKNGDNLHCHAYVLAKFNLGESHYKTFVRDYGFVKVEKVQVDNGIQAYMQKEGVEIFSFDNHIPENVAV